jgi:hypothetical protein
METFHTLMQAVSENNRINDAQWTDWTSHKDLQETYGELAADYKEASEKLLDLVILAEGNTEVIRLAYEILDMLQYGQILHRSHIHN